MKRIIARMVRLKQMVLGEYADQVGRDVGFVRRSVKVSGSSFAQTLVMSFLASPDATYSDMSQTAAVVGLEITPQGLEQRFTAEAAALMRTLLERAIVETLGVEVESPSLLAKFDNILIRDSSIITLPDELRDIWSGVGGSAGETAALKLQVDLDYASGELHGPVLQDGRTYDQKSPYQDVCLPAGALHLADLGYFNLDRLARDTERGVFWITRLKVGTGLKDESGQPLDLVSMLSKQDRQKIDMPVQMGRQSIPCRLVAEQVPPEVAAERIRKLKEWSRKKQQPVTKRRKQLVYWTVLVTNVPDGVLSSEQVLAMMRVRWQVELLFKLWKSHAKVDEWRSENPWRILCEIYAKLLGVVFSQWIFQASLWRQPNRSPFLAAKTIQKFAFSIACVLNDAGALRSVLTKLCNCLVPGCKQQRRKRHPATFQLLESLA